jgi:putative transcriptional regulator
MNLRIPSIVAAVMLEAALAMPSSVVAETPCGPRILVATQSGSQSFGETVLLAVPLSDGGHYGFVLNEPTEVTLAALMPDDEASQKVTSLVHVGGPQLVSGVFAIVREPTSAPASARRITAELSVALDSEDVDRVIAERSDDARFFVGLMTWKRGELNAQLRAGAWQVLPPEASVVFSPHPDSLWDRLEARSSFRPASQWYRSIPKCK